MLTRRSFLLTASAMAAAAGTRAAAGARTDAGGAPLKRIGVQAGSLRAALTRDFAGTLEQIAAIGFREIELQWYGGNFGRTPEQLRAAFDRAGLRATSTLIHAGAMLVGWERHLASAKAIGIEHLAVVNITEDERQSLADCHEWADRFNRAGEIARKAGMWVALHNEPQFMSARRQSGDHRPQRRRRPDVLRRVHRPHRSRARHARARRRQHDARGLRSRQLSEASIRRGIVSFT